VKVTIDLDNKTWWQLTDFAERERTTVAEYLREQLADLINDDRQLRMSIKLMHSRGETDQEIAVSLRRKEYQVTAIRRELGLKPNNKMKKVKK
jgi:predicted DNA-binding ribbon-helix-helix protein